MNMSVSWFRVLFVLVKVMLVTVTVCSTQDVNDNNPSTNCVHEDVFCVYWAKTHQCRLSPDYMMKHCPCNCAKVMPEDHEPCFDRSSFHKCQNWKLHKMCEIAPDYMEKNCKHSCGFCSNADLAQCKDLKSYDFCNGILESGLCDNLIDETNANTMSIGEQFCQRSCSVCSVDGISKEDCANNGGITDPKTSDCFIPFASEDMYKIDWIDAWKECREKTVDGRKGVLAKPKSPEAVKLMVGHSTNVIGEKSYTFLYVGLKKLNGVFYMPSVRDPFQIVPSEDRAILDNSLYWHGEEPNNVLGNENCGALPIYYMNGEAFYDVKCESSPYITGYWCEF